MIKLTLRDDVELTPEVEAWLAETEAIINVEAGRIVHEMLVYGSWTLPTDTEVYGRSDVPRLTAPPTP